MWWPWTIAAVALGMVAWRAAGRVGARWPVVFGGSFLLLVGVIVGRRMPGAGAWLWWLVDARINPLIMAVAVPAMMGVLIRRLERVRQRRAVGAAMGAMFVYYALLPGLLPLAGRVAVAGGQTVVDGDGVCRQTHDFTCGPASTVTCLRSLGIAAEEGEIAVAVRCGPGVGTDPGVLASVLAEKYGLAARYVELRHAGELRAPAVVEVGSGMGWGHYVALIGVREGKVCIGDPELGKFWVDGRVLEATWTGRVVEMAAPEGCGGAAQ